eukprot:scaffold13462_cov15-Tisochrysis_lutea.AAC.1
MMRAGGWPFSPLARGVAARFPISCSPVLAHTHTHAHSCMRVHTGTGTIGLGRGAMKDLSGG